MASAVAELLLSDVETKLITKVKQLLIDTPSTNVIRATPTGHSKSYHSPLFEHDIAIDTSKYIDTPTLKHDLLTASAGSTLGSLREFLKPYGLRLYGTPEPGSISLGGAICFSAHSGSSLWLPMADYVESMLIVNGRGQVVELTDRQLFINYGLLGIVFRITLRVFPARDMLWQHTKQHTIEDAMHNISGSTHSLVFGPYSGRIQMATIKPLELALVPTRCRRISLGRKIWELAAVRPTDTVERSKVRRRPSLAKRIESSDLPSKLIEKAPTLASVLASEIYTHEPDIVRNAYDYFEHIPRSAVYTVEFAIATINLPVVYRQLMHLIQQYKSLYGTRVLRFWARIQPASNLVNSLAFALPLYDKVDDIKDPMTAVTLVEITLSESQPAAIQMVHDISKILLAAGGRPHMGKTVLEPQLTRNYNFGLLKETIQIHDPVGRFSNRFAKQMLMLER